MTRDAKIDSLKVREVAESLEAQVEGVADRVAIAVETELDEAFFVGTQQAFIRLAAALLRTAANGPSSREVANVDCRWSTHTHDVADGMGQVVAGAECVVPTDEERQLVIEHFRNLAGDG